MCLIVSSIFSFPGYLLSTIDSSGSSSRHPWPLKLPATRSIVTQSKRLCTTSLTKRLCLVAANPVFVATAAFQLLCENNSGPSETVSRTKTNLPPCGDLFDCQRPWRARGWSYKTCFCPRQVFKVVKHRDGCPDYWVFWLHRPCWTVN